MARGIPVTVDNFVRAETDRALAGDVQLNNSLGQFHHRRQPNPLEGQVVPRMNRDTLYSSSIFDLDAGPVTLTMPDHAQRFMSLMLIDEDHYVSGVHYGQGTHSLDKNKIGTRYVMAVIRTLADPGNEDDLKAAHGLQDAVRVEQPGGPGKLELPQWDQASQNKVREALNVLGSTLADSRRAFGSRNEVDPVRHLIMTATAWGGNPEKDAIYLNITPAQNDGTTVHKLEVDSVPVDAFWSITVYNAKGYLQANPLNAYNVNSVTARKNAKGSVTVQFGGCEAKTANCLPIMPGWNYTVRLYRPGPEILNGNWRFPEAQPAYEFAKRAA